MTEAKRQITSMERLWTPWRMQYVTNTAESLPDQDRSSIFNRALATADEPDSLVVHQGRHAFVIMNLFPYNTGHMMVVPNRKVPTLQELSSDERADLMELTSRATEIAGVVFRCDGINVGLNLGAVAGAGIADHLHIHVVPRWMGDSNFMPITANTMVLPELLPATMARTKGEFASRNAADRMPNIRVTAGAVVHLPESNQFVLRLARDGSIVLPKGHVEYGESAAEAAIREVREETGFAATITNWAGIDSFTLNGDSFHTVYFHALGTRTPEVDDHLDKDVVLANASQALEMVSFDSLRSLLHRSIDLSDTEEDN